MMHLLKFIIQRKILVGLMVVLILLMGGYALLNLDEELLPSVTMDGAYVNVQAEDIPAIEVERSITTPLEKQLKGIKGVEDINSTTYVGRSSIQLMFERGQGDEVFQEVETLVNSITADIDGVKEVTTGQYSTDQGYELFMDVSGESMEEITAFSKDVLEPRLEELPEVRDVLLSGTVEQQMTVEFNREKLNEKNIDVNQVISAIQTANEEATIGQLEDDNNSPSLRWNTKLESVESVKDIDIPVGNEFITLNEIADVSLKPVDNSTFTWKNGAADFILVQVGGSSTSTQIETAEAVRAEIDEMNNEGIIDGFEVNEIVAQADYVEDSINGVTSNIIIGGIIAVIILLLFLRSIRATVIIGISIPTSILLTFASMWMLDYSLNILTLIGLGLGIGMMVDSSIVILESIYRKKEQGMTNMDSVIQGTKEVATAVIASMLTTIVVFLPIGLLGGEMGSFMIMLSMVVAITLISSVVVSFTLIPSLSERFLKVKSKDQHREDGYLMKKYSRLVDWTVRKKRHSFAVIGLFFLLLVGSLALVTKIPMTIMPDMFNRYAEVIVDLEPGVSPEDKQEIVKEMNNSLATIDDVETSYIIDDGSMFYTIINMTKDDQITKEQSVINEDIMESLRNLQETYPIENVQSAMAGGGGYPVQVNIKGEDFTELKTLSEDFTKRLNSIEGIVGITTTLERTSKEQIIELNKEEMEDAGLTQGQIRQFIQQAFLDMPISDMNINNETIALNVKWDEETTTKSDLLNLSIPTAKGEKNLSEFITLSTVDTPNEISHTDGERFISISADIQDKDLGAINREVQTIIDDFETPTGYTVSTAGDLEQQQELIQEMIFILAIAIFLVYLVMAVQFNHLLHPLIVMSVIPMTIVGVILGLFATQRELSVMSAMGIVMLIGIVLNNAILFIDRTNQLRKEGHTVQAALVEAGRNRIRPIFLTSLTTAGGMLPLALATGSAGNYQAPMATVIISGLLFATFITLLLIPAVYRVCTKTRNKKEKVQKQETEELQESAI